MQEEDEGLGIGIAIMMTSVVVTGLFFMPEEWWQRGKPWLALATLAAGFVMVGFVVIASIMLLRRVKESERKELVEIKESD